MKIQHFADSTNRLPIYSTTFGKHEPQVLVLGGVHGNEPEGVAAAFGLISHFERSYSYPFSTTVVPQFNIEGVLNSSRLNGSGVDLNRNLPTKDWSKEAFSEKYPPGDKPNSEPENQALVSWLIEHKPFFVLSLHSFEKFMMNINGNCKEIAETMSLINQYPIEESIGYPTPGCLGTFAGLERSMPTVTYEIKRGLGFHEIIDVHVRSIVRAFNRLEEVYLRK